MPRLFRMILVLGVVLPSPAHSRTWRVDKGFDGDVHTIQAGIDSASTGDSVLVGLGIFWESINFKGKDIVVSSEFGSERTTINGSLFYAPVVSFKNSETRNAVLEGFTITGGSGTTEFGGSPRGGGILCVAASPTIIGNRILGNNLPTRFSVGAGMAIGNGSLDGSSSPLIQDNVFENNNSNGNGGALSIEHSYAFVTNNTFRNNSCADDGAAVWGYFIDSAPVIEGNLILENHAGDHGGGLHIVSYGDPVVISSNVIARNSASGASPYDTTAGGGMLLGGVAGLVSHNTIVDNRGDEGSVCSEGDGIVFENVTHNLGVKENIISLSQGCPLICDGSSPFFGPNLIWVNASPDLGGCEGALAKAIIADPLFCSPETDDFSLSANSPAFVGGKALGAIETPGCGAVPVHSITWGQIKTLYLPRK